MIQAFGALVQVRVGNLASATPHAVLIFASAAAVGVFDGGPGVADRHTSKSR